MTINNRFAVDVLTALLAAAWAAPSTAQWNSSSSRDEMTGDVQGYAMSEPTGSTRTMGFPYSDARAWLGVGCEGENEWAFVGFSDAPNLSSTRNRDGYEEIRTRIRWDESVENATLFQEWGGSFLQFTGDADVIRRISSSGEVLLELNWYGEGDVYFSFSLDGSRTAIAEMRDVCAPRRAEVEAERRASQAEEERRAAEVRALREIQDEYYSEVYERELAACLEEDPGSRYCESNVKNRLNPGRDGYILAEPHRSRQVQYVEERRSEQQ